MQARSLLPLWVMVICSVGPAQGVASWLAVPLADRLELEDLVVLGTLHDVKPNYYKITWFPGKPKPSGQGLGEYTDVYDEGKIEIERLLRGTWHEGSISLAFDQPNQLGNPFRHMHRSFSEGQRGIWILHRGVSGSFGVGRPDNFLSADSLSKVEAALKFLRKGKVKRPRIIVRKSSNSDEGYTAFVEGRESWTSIGGRSAAEAVGYVVMHSWNGSDLGVDVTFESGRVPTNQGAVK